MTPKSPEGLDFEKFLYDIVNKELRGGRIGGIRPSDAVLFPDGLELSVYFVSVEFTKRGSEWIQDIKFDVYAFDSVTPRHLPQHQNVSFKFVLDLLESKRL